MNDREKFAEQTKQTDGRRAVWFLGFLVFALLSSLVILQTAQVWRVSPFGTASETIWLYALSSLNFIALIIFAFIFLRSVVRLIRERRSHALGAKLKSRLLVYFIAVSFLPVVAMATFSYLFFNRTLEKWFSNLPETVIREAGNLQKSTIAERARSFRTAADIAAFAVENQLHRTTNPPENFAVGDAANNDSAGVSAEFLRRLREQSGFSLIEIADAEGKVLFRSEAEITPEQSAEFQEIRQIAHKIEESAADGLAFDALNLGLTDGKRLILISARHDDEILSSQITNSPVEFERLKQQQRDVRQLGFSTLSLLTFLLIFAASWVAFYLGRTLTQPIRALAVASEEIAAGNLAHRVYVPAEDELGLLVGAFNKMASQLAENRARLELNASELVVKNNELSERRRYIEIVLQTLSTGVISLDDENRLTTINSAAINILQLKNPRRGMSLHEMTNAENIAAFEKLLSRARRNLSAAEQTNLWCENTADSAENGANLSLPVALTATALPTENGAQNGGIVIVIEDLTELINAQRAAAWSEVARRMAHEIKNPLTPIQLAAERIAKRLKNLETQNVANADFRVSMTDFAKIVRDSTETILREVGSLKSMVDEFARFARLPDVRLETGDLNEIVRQSAALFEDRVSNLEIVTNLAENAPPMQFDAEQMRRVLTNLLGNAVESFDESAASKKIELKTFLTRNDFVIEVIDNGKGFASKDLNKLFEPYYSTKNRGTGLGLAIVQRIIAEHGGKIRAASIFPHGAKFTIELPLINN